MRLKNAVAVLLLLLLSSCALRGPVGGATDPPPGAGGTISGVVRTASGTALSGRKVTAINTQTAQRLETSSGTDGGYTMKVAPGHYRLQVEVRDGEVVTRAPDDVHITASDLDAGRNFVIATKN